jgi:Domain of unknown function (DUF4158)
MPVEFLTDDEAAAYGRYTGPPSQADLDRVFFLDDDDLELVGRHRGVHMRAGFALQLTTVRWLGTFLEDPLDVPGEVLDFIAGQLGMADPSQVKRYTEREKTRFDHQWEIRRARCYREFAAAEAEFAGWVAARSGERGRPEGDLRRRAGVAAGTEGAAAGGDHAGAAGRERPG